MKRTDLRTAYGRLGIWPGDMGPQEADIIFTEAMKCRDGATFLEINPQGGRTTAILGTAAKNLGGKLYVASDPTKTNHEEQLWLGRAITLHGLRGITSILADTANPTIRAAMNGSGLDFVLLNGDFARTDFLPINVGTVVVQRKSSADVKRAEKMVDARPAISVWRITEEQPGPELTVIDGGKI